MRLREAIEYARRPHHRWIRRLLWTLLALNILDHVPWVMDKSQAHTWLESIPAFWSLFGFIGCVLIIVASKAFGHAGIMQREDYYDE